MDGGTEVTVVQCGKCKSLLTSAQGSVAHKQRCWSDENEEEDDDESSCQNDESCNTMKKLTFLQPELKLERVKVSKNNCSRSPVVTVTPENKPMARTIRKRNVDPVLKGLETKDVLDILSTSTPRRSRIRAIDKLHEVIEPKCEDESDNDCEWDEERSSLDSEDLEEKPKISRKRRKLSKIPKKSHQKSGRPTETEVVVGVVADANYSFKCNVCGTKFKTEREYSWHMTNIHEDTKGQEVLTCPICGRMLIKRLVFQSHLKHHENSEAIEDAFDLWNKWPKKSDYSSKAAFWAKCKYCLMRHTNHYSFLTHMEREHPHKGRFFKFPCPYSCKMEFDCMKLFFMHMRKDHSEEFYGKTIMYESSVKHGDGARPKTKCDICGKMLDVFYLRAHKETVHSKNPESAKKTSNNSETHPFSCPIPKCFSRCKSATALKLHFIMHLENNPYACKFPGCNVKCDAQCHLDRHMKLHSGKLLQCSKCKVSYSRIDKLRHHVCTYDPTKLKFATDGTVRPRFSNMRLKRIEDLPPDQQLFNEEYMYQSKSSAPNQSPTLDQDGISLEVGSIDHTKGIELVEESAVVVKKELLDDMHSRKSASDEKGSDKDKDYVPKDSENEDFNEDEDINDHVKRKIPNISRVDKQKRRKININSIMLSDPVFIKVCHENPGFRELIMGPSGKGKTKGARKGCTNMKKAEGYKCKDCSTSFKRMEALLKHNEFCNRKIKKDATGIKQENRYDAEENGDDVENVGCDFCGNSFENVDLLNHHLEKDHPEELFKCEECGDLFPSKESRRRHFQRHHEDHPFKCTECSAKFKTNERLKLHTKIHEEGKSSCCAECPQCGKELVNSSSMRRHMSLVHGIVQPVERAKKISPKKKTPKKTVKKITNKSSRKKVIQNKTSKSKRKRRRKRKICSSDEEDDDLEDEDYVFENNAGFLGPRPRTRFEEVGHVVVKTEPELLIEPEESDHIINAPMKGPESPLYIEPKIEPTDDFTGFPCPELDN
ncbi:unnamed protein product [Orchesella dallaii]|uniref:C2H2-type domain-containing protein n=1 Tax=Orchesella dallaii TaxID=48710 RepID=A0ABP1RBX8_9HEXA